MKCKNCGTDLIGMEHACPMCGAPLPVNTNPNPNVVVQQPVVNPMMAPNIITEEPKPEVVEEIPKKDNKMYAIIAFVIAVAAIAVGVFLIITDKNDNIVPKGEQPTENVVEYAGYTFHFPLTYQYQLKEELGFMVTDSKYNTFTIALDYTNTYEAYKNYFASKYPNENIVASSGGREYLKAVIQDSEEHYGLQYVTITPDGKACYIGFIVKPDYSKVVDNEIYVLNEFLDKAEKTEEIEAGAEEDMGRDGIQIRSLEIEQFH